MSCKGMKDKETMDILEPSSSHLISTHIETNWFLHALVYRSSFIKIYHLKN